MKLDFEFKESGLCGRPCTFVLYLPILHIIFLQCPSEHSHLCGRMQCVLRFSVSSALQLLGHSCVGVMDPQNHCAVVTLVVSNCLKKLMSHSCPRSYFVLLSYAGTGSRCRRTRKGVVTSGSDVYMPEVWAQTLVFSHSVTINVEACLVSCCRVSPSLSGYGYRRKRQISRDAQAAGKTTSNPVSSFFPQ